jgi:hypothetical protein
MLLTLSMVCISACKAGTQTPPPTPLTHLDAPQGGKIVFGTVDGATTQATAMSKILDIVKNNCGEKPQIGKVFEFKGTKTVGVFFTVTNHPGGNKKVAGLVLSAASGPRQVEAALLSDDAQRFGKTVNPMIQQLFSVWHPDNHGPAASSASSGKPASGGGASTSGPARLHTVTLPDHSASVGVPDGWKVKDGSGGGTVGVIGPHGERIALNMAQNGIDQNDPQLRSLARYGSHPSTQGRIAMPFNADLTRAYPEVLKQWRHNNGNDTPIDLQNTHAKRVPTQRGEQCVHITGNIVDDDKHNDEMSMILCTSGYIQGNYGVHVYQSLIPVELADRERATAGAIMASFQMNQGVVQQQANAMAAPGIAAIHAIGAQAAAQMKSAEAAHDIQNNAERARQDSYTTHYSNSGDGQLTQAGNNQAFANYLLDQTVVQDNNMYNNGTVGHGTVYNSTADALVKADPNRYEIVDTPNFWQGTDYHQ